jgi:Putative zinc-finger
MVPYLGCEHARDMLQAFIDGELPVEEQVAVETHLRWCRTCAAHVEDLRLIGDSLRLGTGATRSDTHHRELAALQARVLSRVRVEREQSFAMQVRSLSDERHLLWAGLGATMALVVCLFGTMSVLHAASVERPDSLAGVLQSLANPGSDSNPMLLDGRLVQAPRGVDDTPALDQLVEEEAVFALAAVVTREGRISNYDVLAGERDVVTGLSAARPRHVTSLLDKVARSRFTPAEQGVARAPVAVNMVWLLARTTVKGTAREIDFNPPQERRIEPEVPAVVPAAKPVSDENHDAQAEKRPVLRGSSTMA